MVKMRVECFFKTPGENPKGTNFLELDLREQDTPAEMKKQIAILTDVPYKALKLRLNMDYALVA